jgi:cation transport regulator ChaB
MAGESQHQPQEAGAPDPSVLTLQTLALAIDNQRRFNAAELGVVDAKLDVIRERFRGLDEATKVLHETVTRTPTDIQQAIGHLKELTDERFISVTQQFKERDVRSERESRDNKVAVDAAFAAQKEAAAKQDEGNQKAIDKSEKATNETIVKNADASQARADALSEKIDDVKQRLSSLEAQLLGMVERTAGSREQIGDRRGTNTATLAAVGMGITLVLAVLTIIGFILARTP